MTTSEKFSPQGKLILLNCGIGNLGDLTPRNLEALRSGKIFVVEDTRQFLLLLKKLGITADGKVWQSLHDHSGADKIEWVLKNLQKEDVYYLSEAGSAIISDPAYPLIESVISSGGEIDSYSGVSSATMALELAGLPSNPYTFHGFLKREKSKKREFFNSLKAGGGTHVFFEGMSRLEETLSIMSAEIPQASLCICREMSKEYQTVYRGRAVDEFDLELRGEVVVVVRLESSGKTAPGLKVERLAQEVLHTKGKSKALAKLLAAILDQDSSEIYKRLSR